MPQATVEQQGGWFFRTHQTNYGIWMGEAKRGPFVADNAVNEPAHEDLWFDFAPSKDEVIAKLKSQVWN